MIHISVYPTVHSLPVDHVAGDEALILEVGRPHRWVSDGKAWVGLADEYRWCATEREARLVILPGRWMSNAGHCMMETWAVYRCEAYGEPHHSVTEPLASYEAACVARTMLLAVEP